MSPPSTADLHVWYADSIRPFLLVHLPDRVSDLDAALARIDAHTRRAGEELAVCFLGDSGIGKSTLINALVAGQELVLPAGGIGPLTALAMEVRHAPEASFEAEYHNARALWQGIIFGLERGHEAQLKDQTGRELDPSPSLDLIPEGEDDDSSAELVLTSEDNEGRTRLESLRKQAQLLVKGSQDVYADLPYLLDCLREAAGSKRIWGTALLPEDTDRVRRLSGAIATGRDQRSHRVTRIEDPQGFRDDLRDHATGFLAPIIKAIRVNWPSPVLEGGLVLVDLPGVGVAGDVYRAATRKWIVERAKAVVLVVGRSGLTEAAADLLRTSDFLTRLLFSFDEQSHDPVVLAVAMTHVDDAATAAYADDRSKKRFEHLADQFEKARTLVRSQLRQELERVWESGDERVRSAQKSVIGRLVEQALIFPVSAPEYRRFLAGDEDERPFIRTIEQSGVPAMQEGLAAVIRERRQDAQRLREEAAEAFEQQALSLLELLRARWTGSGHTEEELRQLEEELGRVLVPLREEFLVRQGSFREFLKSTMPEKIAGLVGEAQESARREIVRYLRSLKGAHWATLRAAVRREGTFIGSRAINLPDDFARMFVEPVAEVWGRSIIQGIRKRTKEHAGDCERLVVAIADWCRAEGAKVSPKLLDAQLETIRTDVKQIDLAGRDIINELRDQVRNELAKAIEKPIRAKCRQFVAKGDDVGRGVKDRILEMFDELAEGSTTAAAAAAEALLLRRFKEVEQELRQVLRSLDDPLQAAASAILDSHRGRLEREDARNRDRVLSEIDTLTARPEAAAP